LIVNVNRKDLLAQARKTARAAPAGHSIRELSGIFFEADERAGLVRMTATNTEAAIRTTMPAAVESGGNTVIDARLFLDILDKLAGDDVYLELRENGVLYLKSATAHFDIAVLPGRNYPRVDIPFPGDTVSAQGLKSLINKALFAVSANSQNPVLNCLKFVIGSHGLRVMGCNGSCVVQIQGDAECKGDISFLVPAQSLKMLSAIAGDRDVFELGVTGTDGITKNVVLSDGTTLFSARLIEGRFIDADQLFAGISPVLTARLSADKLRTALDLAGGVNLASDRVEITAESGGLHLKCETENGVSSIHADAAVDRNGGETYYYALKPLIGCAHSLTGDVTLCFTKEKTLAVYAGNIRYLQSGTRPAAQKKPKKEPQSKKAAA
jgi:DNA polymerase-3 subunit beta